MLKLRLSSKKWAFSAVALLLLLLATLPFLFSRKDSSDPRTVLYVSGEQRQVIRRVMQSNLHWLNEILEGLADEDWERIERAASWGARERPGVLDPTLRKTLPPEWRNIGSPIHSELRDLNRRLRKNPNRQDVVETLGRITARCVTCHQTFRVEKKFSFFH